MGRGPTKSRLRSFTTADVEAIVEALREIAGDVDQFADELVESQFSGSLSIDGGDAVYDGMEGIVSWLYKARGQYKVRSLRPETAVGNVPATVPASLPASGKNTRSKTPKHRKNSHSPNPVESPESDK